MHITAVPVNLDANEAEALEKAVASFNGIQDKFVIEEAGRSSVQQMKEGLLDWLQLKQWLEENYPSGRAIAVTSAGFTDNWFAHTEGRFTAITTADWRLLFSPPEPHCYLLMEFALASYFYASDISEAEAQSHLESKGCLLDLCGNKREMRWKLRVGYVCSMHRAHFRRHGGSSESLEAINCILDEVRRVTLGLAPSAITTEEGEVEVAHGDRPSFSLDGIKRHPVVVAATILVTGLSVGWLVAEKIWIEPQKERIQELQSTLKELRAGGVNGVQSGRSESGEEENRK